MTLPPTLKKVYSQEQIAERLKAIVEEVSPWMAEVYESTHKPVIIAPVLRGGLFFAVDLMRELNVPFELSYVAARSYLSDGSGMKVKKAEVNTSQVNAFGRSIVLVDEICDSGKTLNSLSAELISAGARQIKTITMVVRKQLGNSFLPSHYGFLHEGDEWFVGYGMHINEMNRNLRDIYTVSEVPL